MRLRFSLGLLPLAALLASPAPAQQKPPAPADALLAGLEQELGRSWEKLRGKGDHPMHFLAYRAEDSRSVSVSATLGALSGENARRGRHVDVETRVGTPGLDNTHQLRESWDFSWTPSSTLPTDDDVDAIRQALWLATDAAAKAAQERFTKVLANKAVKVEEEDPSPDFSAGEPATHLEPIGSLEADKAALAARCRKLSNLFRPHGHLMGSSADAMAGLEIRYFVSSEGHRIRQVRPHARISIQASAKASDGMDLSLYEGFDAPDVARLPGDEVVAAAIQKMATRLRELREAPLVEPYSGPAIIMNKAAGVFFHEIFGHRIEGHRQKDVEEGQTFTKKVGQRIMPDFMEVISDPSKEKLGNVFLNGFYRYDDEGVKAGPVPLIEGGILKNFLMSRSPVRNFPRSNGHGRCSIGNAVVARQANLLVVSRKSVPYADLRKMLLDEMKKAGKPHGLVFHDISGGFTTTSRYGPQAFKVIPLYVVKVFADGKPDQVVRGVDIVGTPIASLEKIVATADDTDIFNGVCGAESGWVPVAAASPSLLVSEIEVEKKTSEQDRPPILPAPAASGARKDVLWAALDAEMGRATKELKMQNSGPPYFVSYEAEESEGFDASASFGAVTGTGGGKRRGFKADVRMGDYVLDNTNFGGGFGGWGGGGSLPIEDDEEAIRREVWLATDRAYKGAIEELARKKADLQNMNVPDRPDDLQKVPPNVAIGEKAELKVDKKPWTERVKALSAVFRDFPAIQSSSASFSASAETRYFLTNEGMRTRRPSWAASLTVSARTQATDGMGLSDWVEFRGRRPEDLPDAAAMEREVRAMAERLSKTVSAPRCDEYVGPMLVRGEAVADFFLDLLVENLANPREPLTGGGGRVFWGRGGGQPFKDRLNRRVVSPLFSIADDPTLERFDGTPLLGHFLVDDDGVPAQKVSLVENGILRRWFMSRVPTKLIKETNGHSRGGIGNPGNVVVTTQGARPEADLEKELLRLAQEQEISHVLVVDEIQGSFLSGGLLAWRVAVADGTREPVRGGQLQNVTLRALRDVLMAAEGNRVSHRRVNGHPVSIVHPPAILVEELEAKKPEEQEAKLPFLASPYFEGKAGK
ncbi:MAG: metallopeptidase TldD-related protein [Planctomycetales bacterium]|nr:metallopeptidase TldD-related protein [Planctomycetales bacterium]